MNTITILLLVIIIIFTYKNITLIKELLISKKFKKLYNSLINKDPDIKNKFEEYLKTEKNEYLISKSNILLMFIYLSEQSDVKEIVDKIDYEKIFLKGGKYNADNVNLNSDMIIWTLCCMPKLKNAGYLSVIKEKIDKLSDVLSNHIEYKVFNAAYSLLNGNKEESKFLDELVNGEYSGLNYDKQLIGITKRIALAYIASQNKEKNLEYVDELKIFASSMLGRYLLTDLEIYDIYK